MCQRFEGMVFSGVSASLSLLNRLRNQRPTLRFVDLQEFKFEIATYDSEASLETATLWYRSPRRRFG